MKKIEFMSDRRIPHRGKRVKKVYLVSLELAKMEWGGLMWNGCIYSAWRAVVIIGDGEGGVKYTWKGTKVQQVGIVLEIMLLKKLILDEGGDYVNREIRRRGIIEIINV